MSDELLLAIDAGTGSCRAALFTPDGRPAGMGRREYVHHEQPGAPGSQVFDTTGNWELIRACIREALGDTPPDAVKAVSATSMREGMVLYDAAGHELWACTNADGRAGKEAAELVESGAAREIYASAGDWVAITAPPRFRWIARHQPDVFAGIAHVGMLGDWILTRLCGEFVTDRSLGSSSAMFDLAAGDWSDRVLEICGLDRSVCPPVVDSGDVVGTVTRRAAEETGLPEGTPVAAAGADTQLALLGIGVTQPGRFTVVGGSFWQHTVVLDEPLIDPEERLRTLCHALPGRWMMEGIGFFCGIVMRWFRDAFCALERREAAERGVDVYDLLEERAMGVAPGANGVVGIFSNLMQASRWVHASPGFVGFDVTRPEQAGLNECFRAIEESAAYVSRGHRQIVEEVAGIEVGRLILTGGAAKGRLWPQIIADALNVPVDIPVVKESTSLGAAICAGVGAGIYAGAAETGARLMQVERTYEPDPAAAERYAALYEQWLELYRRSLELSEAGLARPLWRAAGA